jgi:hypothetical protein
MNVHPLLMFQPKRRRSPKAVLRLDAEHVPVNRLMDRVD